ncbi:unnamed protein product [Rotaria sp. Silwood1]|nr:unnamed protein product [Rotaria sp. Silwood1]CAF1651008.1 unnamed protein product [Rotaria sp. Silwood1]CAF3767458.1 unnamed protein product [Rotaria sp. Silwood1]CAF4846581.1 unnamed protein product [Rotaria sp. Silwood1]CAF4958799.1 unnamed protein product [Rotaria sp. Silwood1]
MSKNNLSAKDEALLILEYLESEHMSKTFLNFLDESKHLNQLRTNLYNNYEKSQQININEINEFQTFFNLSKQIISQLNNQQQNNEITFVLNKNSNDLNFNDDDDDFLNNLINQQKLPINYLSDTSISSVINNDNYNSIEELFSIEHNISSQQILQPILDISSLSQVTLTVPYTKYIFVTQDFLQSIYNQQSIITNNNINSIHKSKRRRRKLKIRKENYYQQRKIMPKIISSNHH